MTCHSDMLNLPYDQKFIIVAANQYSSRKEWERACWKRISESRELLELFTTFNERHNLVMRAAVADRMNSGKKFVQIVEELQLSPQTVSSIKKALQENGYRSYRERAKTERKKKMYSSHPSKKKPYRYYRRTKYGKVYMHHY